MLLTIPENAASVVVDRSVPIISMLDEDETARVIALLVRREKKEGREPKVHGHKTARTLKEPGTGQNWKALFACKSR